ncbi:TnsA endonuclease N-terminal domain-containing protein [Pseudomonas sichuanensis]|uniref:TnsA endonuclease N-terminal domain-containing protein n=1 Tax=Pseudomonas sichuanensis TaxID=2213015 RepID=UPI002160859C|nr:TnsA endonuclease N-terminal domain-containing protein [Pseudomonas sichuanensis]UVK83117.1 TnsA endonuclease N-terminal domain-containing protein [Pseudomonas sichuanensis]
MRGRRIASQQDIERHIANGFGAGAGIGYVPWLRVQDVPSRGRSHKILGVKVDRIYHLLSDLERSYFLVAEFSEDVVDIREQYPLLPLPRAQAIASAIGVRYPMYPGTKQPCVMTTDFLLTVRTPDGSLKSIARTVKYQSDLQGDGYKRTIEKFAIERRFWQSQGVDWTIITEENFTPNLIKNLGLLRSYAKLPRELMKPALHKSFIESLEESKFYPWTLADCLRKIASRLSINYADARGIFFHLIWTKILKVDLVNSALLLTGPLPKFEVFQPQALLRESAS